MIAKIVLLLVYTIAFIVLLLVCGSLDIVVVCTNLTFYDTGICNDTARVCNSYFIQVGIIIAKLLPFIYFILYNTVYCTGIQSILNRIH